MQDPLLLEIAALAGALHPREFLLRIHDWRSMGPGTGLNERVSSSSTYPIPVAKDGGLPDRFDRELQLAARAYKDSVDDAVRLLRACAALEQKYLYEIQVASEEHQEVVSDARSCMKCGYTVEMHQRAERHKARKTTFRLKRGFCEACYKSGSGPAYLMWWHSAKKQRVLD